jgi:cytochrome c7-like protein
MKYVALIAAGSLSTFLTGALIWEGGPDVVIFPTQQVPIWFTHDYHVRKPAELGGKKIEGEGLACTFCHQSVSTSTRSSDRDIPGHSGCDTCHGDWIGEDDTPSTTIKEECKHCHRPEVDPGQTPLFKLDIPNPNIKFGHKNHLKAGVGCAACHGNVPQKTVATRDDYPTMDRCIACHESRGVSTECATCHFTVPSGRIATEYPEGQLKPMRLHSFAIHDADFNRDHAVPAQRDKAYCAKCHSDSYCLGCHNGAARDVRYHPGDWISMHGIRSRTDDYRCQSCHLLRAFCLDCHVRSGVATVGTAASPYGPSGGMESLAGRRTIRLDGSGAPTGPHPMGDDWLLPTRKSFHGFFAQRNIKACVSCHQEQFCITCHASTHLGEGDNRTAAPSSPFGRVRLGGNPHGPNPERLRGSSARMHNARMCLKCHSPADPTWR